MKIDNNDLFVEEIKAKKKIDVNIRYLTISFILFLVFGTLFAFGFDLGLEYVKSFCGTLFLMSMIYILIDFIFLVVRFVRLYKIKKAIKELD